MDINLLPDDVQIRARFNERIADAEKIRLAKRLSNANNGMFDQMAISVGNSLISIGQKLTAKYQSRKTTTPAFKVG